MPNGIIIIDKPADWTSMDVCAKLRGILKEKKIGHAGTLDPMATGVLPVFVGSATRAVEFAEKGDKEYVATLRLGLVTNTQDTTGETLEEHPVTVTEEDLKAILPRFTGEIDQIPPMFSAIKINGKKLYELARSGKEVERKARRITIREMEVLEKVSECEYLVRIRCSKGTYIRTLCHDIGAALGCGAAMSALRRTMACGFTAEDAVTLEVVQTAADNGNAEELLRPVDALFAHLPVLTMQGKNEAKVRNGVTFPLPTVRPGEYRVYGESGEFLMVGKVEDGKLSTVKSFFEV